MRALLGGAAAANVLFLAAIVIGFFHGWIKYRYTGLVSTFAFDMPLTLALVLALTKAGATGSWFPQENPIANGLKIVTGLAVLYVVLPFGVPLLAGLAAFRAWVVIPLIFLLGFHVTRSVRQVELLLLLVIGLCCITVYLGARQTPEEIRAMMAANPDLALRLQGTFFANADGGGGLRAFSTFVSAGAFGGTLSTGGVCAFAFLSQPGQTWIRRAVFAVALGLCAYGINLSGARTAVAMLAMGIALVAWSRQRLVAYVVVPAGVLAVLGVGALVDPARLARFSALLAPAELWGRLSIVVGPGMQGIMASPLGGGLGRSGHGVPYVLGRILPPWDVFPVDGDLGRIAVEFGVPGLIAFGVFLFHGIKACLTWMVQLRGSGMHTVAAVSGAVFILSAATIGTGSPYLGIPGGALTWFLLGAINRLADLHGQTQSQGAGAATVDPRFVAFGQVAFASSDVQAELLTDIPDRSSLPPKREFRRLYAAAGSELPAAGPVRSPGRRKSYRRLFGGESSD